MALADTKCKSCGATLQPGERAGTMVCPYCHSVFTVQNERPQTNVTKQEIHADVVNIIGGEKEFLIEGGTLKKYRGEAVDVTVPDGVFEIENGAFRDFRFLRSVTLPQGLLRIGSGAFQNCTGLKEVFFPDGLQTVSERAFQNCSALRSAELPASVNYLGDAAFAGCSQLLAVLLPARRMDYAGRAAFRGCRSLKRVYIPDEWESVPCAMFEGCDSLEEAILGRRVRALGDRAFCDCSALKAVVFLGTPAQWCDMVLFTGAADGGIVADPAARCCLLEYGATLSVGGKPVHGYMVFPDGAMRLSGPRGPLRRYEPLYGFRGVEKVFYPKTMYHKKKPTQCIFCNGSVSLGKCSRCGAKYKKKKKEK